jgi:hypothetical protein
MISIIKPIDNITFSRNQQLLRVRVLSNSGYPYRALGATAFIEVAALANGLAASNTIAFSYTDADTNAVTTINFVADAGNSDTSLPVFAGLATSNYLQEVFAKITNHPLVSAFFTSDTVTLSGASLFSLEARNRIFDSAPEFSLSGVSGWSRQGSSLPTATTVQDNFAVIFEVFFERQYRDGGWERVARLEVLPDDGGYAAVDIESILSKEWNYARYRVSGGNQAIVADLSTIAFIANNLRRYYLRVGEQQGSPKVVLAWNTSEVMLAIDGGVTHRAWAGGTYLDNLITSLATWRPYKRVVSPLQPAYLSWHNQSASGTASVRITPQGYDGVWGPAFSVAGIVVDMYATATFAVGANQLGLDHATVGRYQVEVLLDDGSGFRIIETLHYTLDCQRYKSLRFLLWRNSWGVPEELRCTGHTTNTTEVARSKAQRALAHGYDTHFQEHIQYDATEERATTYRTGYLSLEEQIALQDMFKVNDVWELQPDGSLCAMDLLGSQMRVYDTRDLLHAFEFEARPRLSVHNHAPGFGADTFTDTNNIAARTGPWQTGAGDNWQTGAGDNWMFGG